MNRGYAASRWWVGAAGKRGFTLIEIIVSLLLVGILAATGGFAIVQATQGYLTVRDNATMTQKAEMAMSRITREIVEMTGITATATATALPVKNVDRNLIVGLDSGAIKVSTSGALSGGDILVDNVNAFTLTYYSKNSSGNVVTSSSWPLSSDIRELAAIDVNLQITRPDGTVLAFLNRVSPRNNKNQGGAAPNVAPPSAPSYGACFVATAAFGDTGHPMVTLLREFRDRFLLTWGGGKWLVDQYYTHGPTAAAWISDKPIAMWAARMILFPVAALTFLVVYAPWAIPFLLLSSLIVTVALFTAGRKGREPMHLSLVRQKGSVLLGLIAAMVVMATLGAAMVPMFSASYMNQAGADQGRKAYFLAESGFRYAASQFLNASSEAAKQTALTSINNKTCNLLNNGGSFTTIVYPFWTVSSSTAGTTLTTTLYGTIPGELNTGTSGYLKIGGNTFYNYSARSGSGTTVTYAGLSPSTPAPAANQDVLPVALPNSGATVTNGGSLTLSGTGADAFPSLNGNFSLYPTPAGLSGGLVFNYERRIGNTLQNITLADPTKTWTNFTVTSGAITDASTTKIILDKYLRLSSTGSYAGSTRQIIYNVPVGWMAGGGEFMKQQFHDQFNNDASWYTAQGMGTHSISGGAMKVDSVVDPTTTGSGLINFLMGLLGWGNDGLWAFNAWNWATTNINLAQAWHDAGGCLSYDLQVKMNNTEPYWMGGVGFRLRNNSDNSDVHTYGLSFIRQRQTSFCVIGICGSFSDNDGINPALRPFSSYSSSHFISGSALWGTQARYSDPGIILWQRNGPATETGSFKILAHRMITAADNLTTGTGVDMRIKAWSSLMVRLLEGYELPFNLGRVDATGRHIKYGDIIRNSDGSKTARVIGTPIMTTAWGGAVTTVGAGRLILTNITGGGFSSSEDLYLDGGTSDAYARSTAAQAATKANYIMVYTSDDRSPAGTGDTIQVNNVRIGNLRDGANWPPDDWTDRTATNDYFTLVQWYSSSTGLGAQMAPAIASGNWTLGTGWTISSSQLRKSSNGTGTAQPNPALTITPGVTYAVSITVTNRTSGSFTYSLGGVTSSSINANGTYTADITATSSGNLVFTPTNTSRFRITAVSVMPYVTTNTPTLDTTADDQGNVASYVDAVAGSDFHWAVIKTAALKSPNWTSSSTVTDFATPGDYITLITSSSAGASTYYDDFAVQLDTKSGTGFLPPIQQ